MVTIDLDLTGLKCPLPALRTKKALAKLRGGERLNVRCTDPLAAIDIPHLINQGGHRLIEVTQKGNHLAFLIEANSL